MVSKTVFDILFTAMCVSSCKIKQIRILEHIAYHVRLVIWQCLVKILRQLSFSF